MQGALPHTIKMVDFPRAMRAGTSTTRASVSARASHLTSARVLKYAVLPGSAVVVLALAAPGFPLGAGDLVDRPFSVSAAAEVDGISQLLAGNVTVPVSSALPQSPASATQFKAIPNGLAKPVKATLDPISLQGTPALVPVFADFAVEAAVAPDIEMQLATPPPIAAPVAIESGSPDIPVQTVEVFAATSPELITPALTELSIAALSDAPIETRTVPLAELTSLPVSLDAAIELTPIASNDEVIAQTAGAPAAPAVHFNAAPAETQPSATAVRSAPMTLSVVETEDLLPSSEATGLQSATLSSRAPVVSRPAPEPALEESAQLVAAPSARATPGLAGDARPALVAPAAPVPALKAFDPAETASLASVIDPIRPATLPPSASASPFDIDIKSKLVTRIDGQVAGQLDFQQTEKALSVRLGSIVELLKDRYDLGEFERITASSASDLFVTMHQLRDAGIPITYDPVYDEFNVGSRDHRPAAAHKVQIDQISVPDYGRGPATMEQVRP